MASLPILAQHDWLDRMADLAFACADASADETADLVQGAHALITAAPGHWRAQFHTLPSSETLSRMLASGAELSAAMALIEGHAGYMLSHAPGGMHLATVVFEGLTEEASAEGETAALALIGALAATMAGPALDIDGNAVALAGGADIRLN